MAGYYVRNANGIMVPLSAFASSRRVYGPEYTNRFNLFRAAQVIGSPAPGYSSDQAMNPLEQGSKEVLPREMGLASPHLSSQQPPPTGAATSVVRPPLLVLF